MSGITGLAFFEFDAILALAFSALASFLRVMSRSAFYFEGYSRDLNGVFLLLFLVPRKNQETKAWHSTVERKAMFTNYDE